MEDDRDAFIAQNGVLCTEHADEFATSVIRREKLTNEEVQEAYAFAKSIAMGLDHLTRQWRTERPASRKTSPPSDEPREKGAHSTTHCKACGSPISMLGTLHVQLLTGTESRDEFVETYGVFCQQHAAKVAQALADEYNFSDKLVQDALACATNILMEKT
jgi:hypothetical protein